MRIRLIVTTLLAATTAYAEPSITASQGPPHYVEGGMAIGAAQPAGANRLASIAGGYRLASSPLWIRCEVTAGNGGDDQGSGHAAQARAGIEARTCLAKPLCGIAGVDLGGHHGTWVRDSGSSSETTDALVAIPRAAFDIGGDQVRVRLGIEVSLAVVGRQSSHDARGDMATSVSRIVGGELTLSVGYLW